MLDFEKQMMRGVVDGAYKKAQKEGMSSPKEHAREEGAQFVAVLVTNNREQLSEAFDEYMNTLT